MTTPNNTLTKQRPALIDVRNVSFSYGDIPVIKNVSLTVARGDYIGLIGANGSGKTTLLKIILGELAPASGTVQLFGVDLPHFHDWSNIGYVPQHATHIDTHFPATVFDVVLMGTYARLGLVRRAGAAEKKLAEAALAEVGMTDYRDRLIGELSGGQQQRVFIARALAGTPDVLLLDEPTVGIDRTTRAEFYALLKKLNREQHLTLILVSHDIDTVEHEANKIAHIDTTLHHHAH